MTLNYQISHRRGIVVYDVQGEGSLENLHQLIDDVERHTRGQRHQRVLVNLLAVGEQLRFTDHYSLGEQVGRKLCHLERLASVVPSQRRTGTSEKVANAQGATLRVFVGLAEAMAWLSEDGAQAG